MHKTLPAPEAANPTRRFETRIRRRARPGAAASLAAALLLTSCGHAAPADPGAAETAPAASPAQQEASTATPRLVMTYDGGIMTADATNLEVIAEEPLAGFKGIMTGTGLQHERTILHCSCHRSGVV